MRRGTLLLLLFIVLLALGSAFVVFWPNNLSWHGVKNSISIKQGLDLQGGISVLLKPDPSQHYSQQTVNNAINNVASQIETRVNGGLGVSSPTIRVLTDSSGNKTIDVELPGYNNLQSVSTLLKPGVLEFWDTGSSNLPTGTILVPSQYTSSNGGTKPLFNGSDLNTSQIAVGTDPTTGAIDINFEMQGAAISKFATFTGESYWRQPDGDAGQASDFISDYSE